MTGGRALTPALAALVLAGGVAVYPLAFPAPPRALVLPALTADEPAIPDAAAPPAFVVDEVAGVVEAGGEGGWRPLERGARLYAGESIRTGEQGHAVLHSGDGDELILRQRVTLAVTSLSRTLTELTLTRGKLRAAPAATSERFAVSAPSARAVAPGGARFSVYADPRGGAFVTSEAGEVQVVAAGRQVTVRGGTQTAVAPGAPPRDPYPVPDEVFLSVIWPGRDLPAARAVVRGRTVPGTLVLVNGVPTAVGDDGSFAAPVDLVEGDNPLEVYAEDVAGRERTVRRAVRARPADGPPLEADPARMYDEPRPP